jgi:hypothetical protein
LLCEAENKMRDLQTVEDELFEICAIPDDSLKLERIAVWCATHADEVPLAIHLLLLRKDPARSTSRVVRRPE